MIKMRKNITVSSKSQISFRMRKTQSKRISSKSFFFFFFSTSAPPLWPLRLTFLHRQPFRARSPPRTLLKQETKLHLLPQGESNHCALTWTGPGAGAQLTWVRVWAAPWCMFPWNIPTVLHGGGWVGVCTCGGWGGYSVALKVPLTLSSPHWSPAALWKSWAYPGHAERGAGRQLSHNVYRHRLEK